MHPVAGAGPEAAGGIEPKAVECAVRAGGKLATAVKRLAIDHLEHPDLRRMPLHVRSPGIGDIEELFIR